MNNKYDAKPPACFSKKPANMRKPNPGSDAAVKQGCICPRIDNHYGKGKGGDGEKYGWFIVGSNGKDNGCALHE